ncbi:5'-methylthioadenosine/adenosylhomocysteine nucleosidase [Candidatus Enterovibrio escicola]|uniref:5'-methylthioadenosine/S-adenosylhomocysteine nucleosidase n=1 Tax=Candidatus Enterovibrio escicola TaxID=1927127 RepID=A0A2A5T642_9GAMM|nr:5'-methylthioadenosine/adenosylhomocysteine nucleosidase [Candidatus Enterovibrio escacola]PCS23631.1 5'-methylthioadenosine nucleosidase [Candidatus Enterovibrio escacola]
MKIGIIGAIDQEINLLKYKINNCQLQEIYCLKFYTGTLNNVDIILLQSGIGKVAAAIATSVLLDRFKPSTIINIGSAGSFDSSLDLGDIVMATEVAYHDVDVTAFDYIIGQMAGQPATFTSDERLMEVAEKALTSMVPIPHAVRGMICTGDSFVHTDKHKNYIRKHFQNVIAVEMEAAAVAQTCHQFRVPFVVIRAISDLADKKSPTTFKTFLPLAAKNSSTLIEKMIYLLDSG